GAVLPPPFNGDPGEFTTGDIGPNDTLYPDRMMAGTLPIPLTEVGASVTLVDGWLYVTYRNGHTRAYSIQGGGGGPGTGGGTGNTPIFTLPPPNGIGNQTFAPDPLLGPPGEGRIGIHITTTPNDPTNTANYRDRAGDRGLLLEWGETIHVVVDFGPASALADDTVDVSESPRPNRFIDRQITQNEVQAQIRSSNGAVQQLPGATRGARPREVNGRIVAVIPVFAGVPSPTNPLTPGTPLLWERGATEFQGELTYDLQVTQQGIQWSWEPRPNPPDQATVRKQHYWEIERPNGNQRFPTTAGGGNTPNWTWESEWAPLVSYNNPITMAYDPNPSDGGVSGIFGAGGATDRVGWVDEYTSHLDPGRKNGDQYAEPYAEGARSGAGRPVVPVVGQAITGTGGSASARQALFADHGKSSPVSTTLYPDAGKLRVADRSHLANIGRNLQLRVQRAPLTKMGKGADYGTRASGDASLRTDNLADPNAPKGSFQQNTGYFDDGPHQLYSSIPETRLAITKLGTALDLASGPVQVGGRRPPTPGAPGNQWRLPVPFGGAGGAESEFEQLAVQVDVPTFTADDIYSTRWRNAGPNGSPPQTAYNPFFPGTLFGEAGRPLWDRAERLSRPTPGAQGAPGATGQGPFPVPGEDRPLPGDTAGDRPDDDRLRRVVIFNDANNNGLLDLQPTYREAYRTFGVQVMVKPDMRMDAVQQLVDLGNLWHGKKQPGLGGGVMEIREWQRMEAMSRSNNAAEKAAAQFYGQFWKKINILNTGNVNLAYLKPEVAYQIPGSPPQLIGLPSEGNDPWRALSLINGSDDLATGDSQRLRDPFQIFLRTSFDDQLLPNASAPYGAGARGVWLQKAPAGAAQPGVVAYAAQTPTGNTLERDPSVTGIPRELWL
ncbi:MAG TPA: hypothetical protein VK689_01050, partial [Armatimonadota bacterium]|nr:hypothetical protein [Armatimonadota bacterium]